jgi:hypothetical protein
MVIIMNIPAHPAFRLALRVVLRAGFYAALFAAVLTALFARLFAALRTAASTRAGAGLLLTLALALVLALAGCGGGGGGGSGGEPTPTPTPVPPPVVANPEGAGHFDTATLITTVNASAISAALPSAITASVKPLYSVDAYKLTYTTSDAQGRLVTASGLVALPRKTGNAASPLLSYQHATAKTDAEAPSNHATADEPAILFASLGYLVSAADYVGYGATKGLPHPYLLATPSAAAVQDFLTASSRWRQMRSIADNGQLFLTGYSEGAYASMAALRRMTQVGTRPLPVASFLGAGPYNATRTMSDALDVVRSKNPILGALISPGFLKRLGANDRANVRNLLLSTVLGNQSDVSFDGTFLDNFLADDNNAIDAQSNVYDWTPQSPLILFHGRGDTTVSYANTDSTLQAMTARGAGALVEKIDCPVTPSEHIACVPSFLQSDITRLAALARGL